MTDNIKLIRPIGDYRKLYCYQKAEAIYDITYFFVEHFLFRGDRTIDQMKQAARSQTKYFGGLFAACHFTGNCSEINRRSKSKF